MTQNPEKNIGDNKDAIKSAEDLAWQAAVEAIEKAGPPPKETSIQRESGYSEEYKGDGVTSPEDAQRLLEMADELKYQKVKQEIARQGGTVEIKANVPEKQIAEIHTIEDLNGALQQSDVDYRIQDGIKDAFSRAETLLDVYGSHFAYGNPDDILKEDLDAAKKEFENELQFAQMPGRLREVLMPKINELFERLIEQKKIAALEEKRKTDEFNAAEREARKKADEERVAQNNVRRQEIAITKKSWYQFWK